MKTFLAILATAALVASAAQAGQGKYHNEMRHGSSHHTHADGNWHGNAPHMHDGKKMHRGHQHAKPVVKCAPVRWHNTKDLQKWRVDNAGNERCYDEAWGTWNW